MEIEITQIKFTKSEQTGDLIGFVSRIALTGKLKGVREDSIFGKLICVLCDDLKGKIIPDVLYAVELRMMLSETGYVVVAATPIRFAATVESVVLKKNIYQVTVTFGNKSIYFDPNEGRHPSSRTRSGVIELLRKRQDIDNLEDVLKEFSRQAKQLIKQMEQDGYILSPKC